MRLVKLQHQILQVKHLLTQPQAQMQHHQPHHRIKLQKLHRKLFGQLLRVISDYLGRTKDKLKVKDQIILKKSNKKGIKGLRKI